MPARWGPKKVEGGVSARRQTTDGSAALHNSLSRYWDKLFLLAASMVFAANPNERAGLVSGSARHPGLWYLFHGLGMRRLYLSLAVSSPPLRALAACSLRQPLT